MSTLLIVLLVIACIMVITAVLLQPAKGGTATAFGGSSQSLFGSTGATSFLFKITMWGAAFIMFACLMLSILSIRSNQKSVIDTNAVPMPVPAPIAPVTPPAAAPIAPTSTK
ncbi:MAG: preprotein translocase subunit SecG [Bdellovibrionales bacterium]|nr:preprotein translocase subunit SecG [Bdellovibrionales bacterium]